MTKRRRARITNDMYAPGDIIAFILDDESVPGLVLFCGPKVKFMGEDVDIQSATVWTEVQDERRTDASMALSSGAHKDGERFVNRPIAHRVLREHNSHLVCSLDPYGQYDIDYPEGEDASLELDDEWGYPEEPAWRE